jgi:F0F1-type ATP synthase membrane subunit b/b'
MYMPNLLFQVITVVFDLVIVVFVAFYLIGVRNKEKNIDKRESKLESDYSEIVGNGMARERQILDNAVNQSNQIMQIATHQANQVLAGAQYISQTSKASLDNALQRMVVDVENVSSSSKMALDQALQKIVVDVHKEAYTSGNAFTASFQASLKQITTLSLSGFQNVTSELELALQQQIRDFRQQLLANLEKEIETYKTAKMHRIEQASNNIVQKTAQEILNKSLSLEDHQNLVIKSLERAKKDGLFD